MFLTVVLMLGAGSALAKIERFNSAYLKAEKLYKAKNYEKAEKLYKRSLELCSTGDMDCRIKTLLGLRMIYIDTKQYEQALQIQDQFFEDYQHGKEIFYNLPSLLKNRAYFYKELGKLEQASTDYQEAIRLEEQEFGLAGFTRVGYMGKLAEVYELQGKSDAATELKTQIEAIKAQQKPCDKDTDLSSFIGKLNRRIRGNWHPPVSSEIYQIITAFRILPDGSISKVRLTKLTNSLDANQAAFAAIQRSAPFKYVPAFCGDYLYAEFIFDYEINR